MISPTAILGDDFVPAPDLSVGDHAVLGVDGPSDADPTKIGAGSVIRSHAIVYRGAVLGQGCSTGHGTLIRENCIIGDGCSVGSRSILEHSVTLGTGVRVHSGSFMPEFTVIEDGAWVGPCVVFTNAKYPNRPDTKSQLRGVTVGANAVIGAGAVILPGVKVGHDSIVGAGAVVTRDVVPGSVVVGNPAQER